MYRLLAIVSAALVAGGCGGTSPKAAPTAEKATASALLDAADLPDGYSLSPPDAAPEVSAASSPSVPGCDALLDYFSEGAGPAAAESARFEAGGSGPFLAEELSDHSDVAQLGGRCGRFTSTDADGVTTAVTVAPVTDFPRLGDAEQVFSMHADGGTGDAEFQLSGFLVVVRVGPTTCTLVHFGQPGVDRAETETIARAAVTKIKRRQ
ncbi:hypothetical protein AB0M46_23855 [Dactylosporangium sp. NPDC051485]|uniref:hypothetical protein n=1 Tax=Dactylosporangium sp. NPDC051485 TaxID=3154846 RepID=UPI00344807F7